jgi:hypothetical protein
MTFAISFVQFIQEPLCITEKKKAFGLYRKPPPPQPMPTGPPIRSATSPIRREVESTFRRKSTTDQIMRSTNQKPTSIPRRKLLYLLIRRKFRALYKARKPGRRPKTKIPTVADALSSRPRPAPHEPRTACQTRPPPQSVKTITISAASPHGTRTLLRQGEGVETKGVKKKIEIEIEIGDGSEEVLKAVVRTFVAELYTYLQSSWGAL